MDAGHALRAVLVLGLIANAARAETATVVRVGGACLPPDTRFDEVLGILRAELSPSVVVGFDVPVLADDVALLTIEACKSEPAGAGVRAQFGDRRRSVKLRLEDATPDTRSRTFALALAEAVRDVTTARPSAPEPPMKAPDRIAPPVRSASPEPGHNPGAVLRARAAVDARVVPESTTPAFGIQGGIAGRRAGAFVELLGARRSTSIGDIEVFALAAGASVDALELGPVVRVRASGELGIAIGNGSPRAPATDRSATALHAALSLGAAAVVPLNTDWAIDGFVGVGRATSLSAEADGRDAVSLGGWFVTGTAGVRFPPFGGR